MGGIEETGPSSRERGGNEGPSGGHRRDRTELQRAWRQRGPKWGGVIIYKTLSDPVPTTVCQGIRLYNKCMSMHLNANANVLVTHLQMHLN